MVSDWNCFKSPPLLELFVAFSQPLTWQGSHGINWQGCHGVLGTVSVWHVQLYNHAWFSCMAICKSNMSLYSRSLWYVMPCCNSQTAFQNVHIKSILFTVHLLHYKSSHLIISFVSLLWEDHLLASIISLNVILKLTVHYQLCSTLHNNN